MPEKKRARVRGLVLLIAGVLILAGVLIWLNQRENDQYREQRDQMSEGFGTLKTIQWEGSTYREKPAVTTLLVAGVDREGTITETNKTSYRDGGQADFLMLLSIDHTEKKIYRLQIDRDTMTEVDILGVFVYGSGRAKPARWVGNRWVLYDGLHFRTHPERCFGWRDGGDCLRHDGSPS